MNVVLITGAASGLGWALAQAFAQRGDRLLLVDLNESLLHARQRELGSDHLVIAGDLTDVAVQEAIATLVERDAGRLDVLVNNAGITHRSLVASTDVQVFERVMRVDWYAPVQLTCRLLPWLETSRGMIINIGSMAGWMPVLGRAAYCAAKAALGQFFEVLRCEVADRGIHVLNVYPSFLDTAIEHNALDAHGGRAVHARSTVGQVRSADWMAAQIVRAAEHRKPWLFPDRLSWFGSVLWRVWPSRYLAMMRKRFAVELQQ